jgi:hypothetical protein
MRFKIFTRHAERKIPNERYVPPLLVFVLFLHEKYCARTGPVVVSTIQIYERTTPSSAPSVATSVATGALSARVCLAPPPPRPPPFFGVAVEVTSPESLT